MKLSFVSSVIATTCGLVGLASADFHCHLCELESFEPTDLEVELELPGIATRSCQDWQFVTETPAGDQLFDENSCGVLQRSARSLCGCMPRSIMRAAELDGNYTILTAALAAVDLYDMLDEPYTGSYTLFGPRDTAFENLPADFLEELLDPDNTECLYDLLSYHIVWGEILEVNLTDGLTLNTLHGEQVVIDRPLLPADPEIVFVNEANITHPDDHRALNGVLHGLSEVLFPDNYNCTNATLAPSASPTEDTPADFVSRTYPGLL